MIITRTFTSSSNPSLTYNTVLDDATGETSCNCPGWTFAKLGKPRECKHTKLILKEAGLAPPSVPAVVPAGLPVPAALDPIPVTTTAAPAAPVSVGAEVQPMLASAMPVGKSIMDYVGPDWVLEEKIDGHRLLVTVTNDTVTARTRPSASHESNDRQLPPHIVAAALTLMPGIYDAELYLPGGKATDVARIDNRDKLKLAIFDVIEMTGTLLVARTYKERESYLMDSIELADTSSLHRVAPGPVSKEAVEAIWARGGEGAILKHVNSPYTSGARSEWWIKVKKIESAKLMITGFKEGKLGPHSICVLMTAGAVETTVKVLDNATLADIAKDPTKYIGSTLVIEHQGITKNGAYRHPMWDHVIFKA